MPLATVQGRLNLGLGQAGVGAELSDGNVGAGGLAKLGADALEEPLTRVVAGAGETSGVFRVNANLGHDGAFRGRLD